MPMARFVVRPTPVGDARAMADLFAAVAEERDGIATEPPVEVEERPRCSRVPRPGRLSPLRTTVEWARGQGLHKLSLEVFANNSATIGLLL
jgi:hypothetical protein